MHKRQAPETTQITQDSKLKRFFKKFTRVLIYTILIALLAILLIFSVAAAYLYQNPQGISQTLAEEVKKHTGIETSFSSVDVTLMPLPALALSHVELQQDDIKLNIAYATASPSLLSLLRGKFTLGHITLVRPNISVQLKNESTKNTEQSKSNEVVKKTSEATSSSDKPIDILEVFPPNLPIPSLLFGTDIKIIQGQLNLTQDNKQMLVSDINADIDISLKGVVNTSLNLGSSSILEENKPLANIDNLDLNISGLAPNRNKHEVSFSLNTRLSVAGLLDKTFISAEFSLNPNYKNSPLAVLNKSQHMLNGSFNISGNILWRNAPIPLVAKGQINGNPNTSINIENVYAQLDNDIATLTSQVNNVFSDNPTLTGEAKIKQLNLTQWFGFARNLPPGLQVALQGITDGTLRFSIDKEGLKVPFVQASAVGATFKGTGGVSSWDNIIIKLDLKGPYLSLIKAFPESEGIYAQAPTFSHDPLTPIPGTPEAESMTGPSVGYDINISVDELSTWNLTIENVDFKCIPTEQEPKTNPKNHPNAVLLDFKINKIYGGRGAAKVILFRTKEKKSGYDITAILRNMRAQDPLTILAGREIFGGRLSLDTSFIAYGKNLGEFLISKNGDLTLRTDNGFFTSRDKNRTTFKTFTVAGKFNAKPLTTKMINRMPEVLRYNGIWRTTLDRPDFHSEAALNGIITLVGRNYTDLVLDKTPGNLQVNLHNDVVGLKQDLLAVIDGGFSFNSVKYTFGISDANVDIPSLANAKLKASLALDYEKDIEWEANINGKTDNLSTLLGKLSTDGISPVAKSAPQTLSLAAKLTHKKDALEISNLNIGLDKMNATGNIKKTYAKPSSWDVNLKLNLLDWDLLFPPTDVKNTASTQNTTTIAKNTNIKPWSLAWIRENKVKGKVNIDVLRLRKTVSTNVNIPIQIGDGLIHLSPITATFYGAPAKINFKGKDVNDALHIQGGIQTENVNMRSLSHDLKFETVIGGQGSLWASTQGILTNSQSIFPEIEGTWRIKIGKGYFQTLNEDGTLEDDKTNIDAISDSGPLSKGILYSKNLSIIGPDLEVTGYGEINLINDTLDMHLIATSGNFHDIPVHYYGSFDDPQRDLDTGSVIVGAISSFGLGFFDIIGGALKGIFSLFQK